jgi:hypothetical protein
MNDFEVFAPGAFRDLPKTVPFKDQPGGATIGSAEITEDEAGLTVRMTFDASPAGTRVKDALIDNELWWMSLGG